MVDIDDDGDSYLRQTRMKFSGRRDEMARKFQSESVACSVNVIRGGGDNLVFGKESQASKPKPILRPYFSVSSSFSFFLLFSSSESTSERKRRRDEHNYFNRLVSVFST